MRRSAAIPLFRREWFQCSNNGPALNAARKGHGGPRLASIDPLMTLGKLHARWKVIVRHGIPER